MAMTAAIDAGDLAGLSHSTKAYLKEHLVDFLEDKHSLRVSSKLNHSGAKKRLKPVETFEYEIKHLMSAAAHEILLALDRLKDVGKARTTADKKAVLRYARTNLEEA